MQIKFSVLTAVAVTLLTACTQQQQERISSSDIDKKLQERIESDIEHTKQAAQGTTNWLGTEARLRALEIRVRALKSDDKLPTDEKVSLENSVQTIRSELQTALMSGQGMDPTETDAIITEIKLVENRLEQFVASRGNKPL